jgi:hypothetical protein
VRRRQCRRNRPRQAPSHGHQGIGSRAGPLLSSKRPRPFHLVSTLCYATLVYIFRQEPPAAADYAGRALRICEEHRIAHWRAYALCLNGWALGASGESEKGLTQIRQGVDGFGLGPSQHILLALQADAQLAIGKAEAALASVTAGLEAVEKTGGAPLEAELHRLRGEALLAGAGTVSEAETAMQQGNASRKRIPSTRRASLPHCVSIASCVTRLGDVKLVPPVTRNFKTCPP